MEFLLIHGGWQGGWCWDGVVAELERRGHRGYAPTMPGLEPGEGVDRSPGLDRYVEATARFVVDHDLHDLVVVAHSGGGPIGQGVVEQVPDRVVATVFVDAWVLQDGEAIFDILAPEMVEMFQAAAAASSDRTVAMPEELWVGALCNDLPAEEAKRWMARVVDCPLGFFDVPVALPAAHYRSKPTAYVFLDEDVIVERAIYERMAARLDGPRVTNCPGAHEAMLSQPAALTDAVLRVAG